MNFVRILAEWDSDVSVWTATSPDVPGLVAEAATIEKLRTKAEAMIGDLIEEGVVGSSLAEIPVHIIASMHVSMKNPVAA